jgi:hypothetical protein
VAAPFFALLEREFEVVKAKPSAGLQAEIDR